MMKLNKLSTICLVVVLFFITDLYAKKAVINFRQPSIKYCSSKRLTTHSKKTYTPKGPYTGFGQKSSVNGRIKIKSVRGHFRPSNNYKFVNPYARSK